MILCSHVYSTTAVVSIPYRMEAESESNFSRYQVVQSVSQIAKEFGSLKRHIEIGKLTSLCAQLQDSPASTMKGGAMGGAKGTSHVC